MCSLPPPPDQKTALQQFEIIVGYLQYENAAYWQRATVLVAGQAAFLGLIATVLPSCSEASVVRPALSTAASIVGLGIACIGGKMLDQSEYWIERWTAALLRLESHAFGNIELFRHMPRPGLKSLMKELQRLLGIAWFAALIFSAIMIGVGVK